MLKEFGLIPKIAWSVDPFGHSLANAMIYAEAGYHAFFIGRIDYQDKSNKEFG